MRDPKRRVGRRPFEQRDGRRAHRGSSGLASLEWLLVVAAVGGFAAVTAVGVQRIVDDTAQTPADPNVRKLEAEVAAAEVSGRAATALSGPGIQPGDPLFSQLQTDCEAIAELYPDAIADADWVTVTVQTDEPAPTTAAAATTTVALHPDATDVPDTTLPPDTTTPDTTTPDTAPTQRTVWMCRLTRR